MIRLPILMLSVLFLTSLASATSLVPPDELFNLTGDNVEELKEVYNENSDSIPGIAKKLIGDQRINLYLGNQSLRAEMDNARIDNLENDTWEDPSLEIWVDEKDIEDVAESDQPGQELRYKFDKGDIRYQEYGVVNRIKFKIIRLFI